MAENQAVGYWLDHRRHKQEVKNLEAEAQKLKAETRQKYMDLAKMYVDEFTKNIATPLEKRVDELTNEVMSSSLSCPIHLRTKTGLS